MRAIIARPFTRAWSGGVLGRVARRRHLMHRTMGCVGYIAMASMRRFFWRPSEVSLGAIGFSSP